jgi:hypothetical protein
MTLKNSNNAGGNKQQPSTGAKPPATTGTGQVQKRVQDSVHRTLTQPQKR